MCDKNEEDSILLNSNVNVYDVFEFTKPIYRVFVWYVLVILMLLNSNVACFSKKEHPKTKPSSRHNPVDEQKTPSRDHPVDEQSLE